MLSRVVRLVGEAVSPIVVVAAPGQILPPLPGETQVTYDKEGGRGPLQGLAAGLTALADRVDIAFVSGCDVPFLQPAFIQRMADLLGDNAICVPQVGGYDHPLAAIYRLDVLPVVIGLLQENRLRATTLFEKAATRFVAASEIAEVDPDLRSLRNLNTPEEYEDALRELVS